MKSRRRNWVMLGRFFFSSFWLIFKCCSYWLIHPLIPQQCNYVVSPYNRASALSAATSSPQFHLFISQDKQPLYSTCVNEQVQAIGCGTQVQLTLSACDLPLNWTLHLCLKFKPKLKCSTAMERNRVQNQALQWQTLQKFPSSISIWFHS